MNHTIRQETEINAFGHKMRAFPVIATEGGRIIKQEIKETAFYKEDGHDYRIVVELSFDDDCRNGHETFHVTADIREKTKHDTWREHSGGCCHEEIAKRFPHLAHLVKWHFMQINEPMYYIANTVFHASDKDCWGKVKGEPASYKHGIKFDAVPITIRKGEKFCDWLKQSRGRMEVQPVPYTPRKDSEDYKFSPKYTLFYLDSVTRERIQYKGVDWYDSCPFDDVVEAEEFRDAFNDCEAVFVTVPDSFSEGKEHDFKGARSCGMWPEATDEQLSLPKAELTKLLQDRLPQLVVDFKADMDACGFVYPTQPAAKRGE